MSVKWVRIHVFAVIGFCYLCRSKKLLNYNERVCKESLHIPKTSLDVMALYVLMKYINLVENNWYWCKFNLCFTRT